MAEDAQIAAAIERRRQYESDILALRTSFKERLHLPSAGVTAVYDRSAIVDALVSQLWAETSFPPGVTLVAVGGYGRRELFPYSDVDLMFLLDGRIPEKELKTPVRQLNQCLWDCGLRVSPMTRTLAECEKFNPENVEFTLALLDARFLVGDLALFTKLTEKSLPRLIARDRKNNCSPRGGHPHPPSQVR